MSARKRAVASCINSAPSMRANRRRRCRRQSASRQINNCRRRPAAEGQLSTRSTQADDDEESDRNHAIGRAGHPTTGEPSNQRACPNRANFISANAYLVRAIQFRRLLCTLSTADCEPTRSYRAESRLVSIAGACIRPVSAETDILRRTVRADMGKWWRH